MSSDLVGGRITQFRREQGFGLITLDDGRELKFDGSICVMVPEEGMAVRVRVGPAKWGGGEKAVHVEPVESADSFLAAKPEAKSLDDQLAIVEAEHLVAGLTESVMDEIVQRVFAGKVAGARLLDVLDAYYAGDPARAAHDGFLRHGWHFTRETGDVLAELAARLPGATLPAQRSIGEHEGAERGTLRATLRVAHPDGREEELAITSLDDVIELVNRALRAAGDARRVYALATHADWHAYYALASDRAKRLAGTLPFAVDPKLVT